MKATVKYGFVMAAVLLATIVMIPYSSADSSVTTEDGGNIAWVLICSALVFIMTPGVALFYGGMLRRQSMSSVLAQTGLIMGIMAVSWVLVGYSLAFSGDLNGIIGNLDKFLLNGVSYDTIAEGSTIPDMEFMVYRVAPYEPGMKAEVLLLKIENFRPSEFLRLHRYLAAQPWMEEALLVNSFFVLNVQKMIPGRRLFLILACRIKPDAGNSGPFREFYSQNLRTIGFFTLQKE